MACKDCEHLKVPLNKAGRRVASKDKAYECSVEKPKFPACFREQLWRTWMSPDDGEGCIGFSPIKTKC